MIMKEYENKFQKLLKYFNFNENEKFNIFNLLSSYPLYYSGKIKFDEHKSLEELKRMIRKKLSFQRAWNGKKRATMEQRMNEQKPSFFRNNSQPNQLTHLTQTKARKS